MRAFGFTIRIKVVGDNGSIEHSELTYHEALLMIGSTKKKPGRTSPRSIEGGNTQALMLFVDNVDAHCAHARAAGAKILSEPTDVDYGQEYWADRCYEAEDLEGHRWWFAQRIRDPK